jgi:hypothetical protein
MYRFIILVIQLHFLSYAWADTIPMVKRDLFPEWLIYQDKHYSPYKNLQGDKINIIHIRLPQSLYRGDFLQIESKIPVSLFVDGLLVSDRGIRWSLALDSLFDTVQKDEVYLSIYSDRIINASILNTRIITWLPGYSYDVREPIVRSQDYFNQFIILVMLFIIVLFSFMLRLNPKQMAYYFSIGGIFSQRETDDSQAFHRIASSGNLLFYILGSLLTGFLIVISLHNFKDHYQLAQTIQSADWVSAVLSWLKVSIIVLVFFFIKAAGIYLLAFLFGMKDHSGFQFLDFIRIILISTLILLVVESSYYLVYGEGISLSIYKLFGWILGAWIILLFWKLLRRSSLSVFHLFSYICATEIIPFLLIVKVLYE